MRKYTDNIQEYLDLVCAEVRYKQAHPGIRAELAAHLEDQAESYRTEGKSETEAAALALRDMGDPHDAGLRFDAAYRPRPTWKLLLPLACLLFLGFLLHLCVYGPWMAGQDMWVKYFVALALGTGLFLLFYRINLYRVVNMLPRLYYFLLVVLVVDLALQSLHVTYPGGYRPDLTVYVLPTLLAGLMYSLRGKGLPGLLFCCVAIAVPTLLLIQRNMRGFAALSTVSCLVVLTTGIIWGCFGRTGRQKTLALSISYGGALLACTLFLCTEPHRLARLIAALNPAHNPNGIGYLGYGIQSVLDASRFFGPGSDTEFLSMVGGSFDFANDFLLTHLVHSFGYVVLLVVLLLFAVFLTAAVWRTLKLTSLAGRLLSLSLIVCLGMQALSYILANFGFIAGIYTPLPFLSYGNTSLLMNLGLMGLLISLLRNDGLYTDADVEQIKPPWEMVGIR